MRCVVRCTGRLHKGLSSTYLKEKLPGTRVPVFLRQSSFRLPSDTMVPLLMVGAGTGLAPYRAFLQERKVLLERGASFRAPCTLFRLGTPHCARYFSILIIPSPRTQQSIPVRILGTQLLTS